MENPQIESIQESNIEYPTNRKNRCWIDASDEDSELQELPPLNPTTKTMSNSRDDQKFRPTSTDLNSPRLHTLNTTEAGESKVQLLEPHSLRKRLRNRSDSHLVMDIEDGSENVNLSAIISARRSGFTAGSKLQGQSPREIV